MKSKAILNKPCRYIFCKHNAAQNPTMIRYGDICLHTDKCPIAGIEISRNVINVLDCKMADHGYKNLQVLSNDELGYCLQYEPRKRGQAKLKAEAARRKEAQIHE